MASKKAITVLLRELLGRMQDAENEIEVARVTLEATNPRSKSGMDPVYPGWCATVNQRADYRAAQRKKMRENADRYDALEIAIAALERAHDRKPARKGR